MTDSPSHVLSTQEVTWVIQSLLRNPERLEKGASEEDIIRVIKWAEDLKFDMAVKFGILHEIYRGSIVTNTTETGVVMSLSPDRSTMSNDRDSMAKTTLMNSIRGMM